MSETSEKPAHKIGLFVTCLVDMMRPGVGFAAAKLLEAAGCQVAVPETQTCCGQPAFNSGDNADTAKIARAVIEAFEDFDYLVVPSGSCAAMIREHYAGLFATDPHWAGRAHALSARTHELTSFLVDICQMQSVESTMKAKITYHDSCSGLRELSVREQPRQLLKSVGGVEVKEMKTPETCCGFGGTFCVKYAEISDKIVDEKYHDIMSTGADVLLAGDLGCLLNMAGKLHRKGASVKAYHVAEVLANMADGPAIGAPSKPFTVDNLRK